ncbi:hypothetical protein PR048_016611 [Dryococelus australis]|uniref:Uncharacterized protein n=1 Tax=Dryococelus australis TaxID=614101 RepID=A0ABQ9H7P4_9NEOP|nr:hypothetical protein PR048_016611 [Dryococelus australis]
MIRITGHYLPDRPELKDHCMTEVRAVFDASSIIPPNPSLNDCLEEGPNSIERFDLRCWEFTDLAVDFEEMPTIFGLLWSRGTDTLSLNVSVTEHSFQKEDSFGSAQNFEPIGMATPIMLIPKLLIEKFWQEDLSWDEHVPLMVEDCFH